MLCISIVLFAKVPFRSAPRILGEFFLGGQWIPHFTSAINWTLRAGLGLLGEAGPAHEPWIAIMDHSIDVGTKKVLAVLRVRAAALAEKGAALSLADCECIGLDVSERTDGETVARALSEIFQRCGHPLAILKDSGSDLARGVALWKERSEAKTEILQDVGHVAANALKAEYAKRKPFMAFLELAARAASRLRQTKLAFLAPPRLRAKGRFQGILRLAEWSTKIIAAFDEVRGNAEYEKLRNALAGFSGKQAMVRSFAKRVIAVNEVLRILKNNGLNQTTFELCKPHLDCLAPASKLARRLSTWFQAHLEVQVRLGLAALPVSSDVIESLFGKFKAIQRRGPILDMNRLILAIPALCGAASRETILRALAQTSQRDLAEWDKTKIPYTQNRKRRDFLRRGSPAPAMETGKPERQTG